MRVRVCIYSGEFLTFSRATITISGNVLESSSLKGVGNRYSEHFNTKEIQQNS